MKKLLKYLGFTIDLSIYPPIIQYYIGIDACYNQNKLTCAIFRESIYEIDKPFLISIKEFKITSQEEFIEKINEISQYYNGAILIKEGN
jgi:hypothetical protein